MSAPEYHVWCQSRGETRDDAILSIGGSPQRTAEWWADQDDWDSVECSIVKGETVTVCVENTETNELHRFSVSGQSIRDYSAKSAPPDTPSDGE